MKKSSKVSLIIFMVVLLGALIALFIPNDYKNFSFLNVETRTSFGLGLNKSQILDFDILNKTSNAYNNVDIKILYTTKNTNSVQEMIVEDINLEAGINEINDIVLNTYQSFTADTFYGINSVYIKYSNISSFFKIYAVGDLSSTGWFIICLVIIGAVGSLTSMFVWLTNAKFTSNIKDWEQKVKQNFKDFKPNLNTRTEEQFSKRVVCRYCKTAYSNDLNRCPNCGAPFEP